MAKIIREDGELIEVTISGKAIDIEDAGEDHVFAECSIEDLKNEVAGDWPEELTLRGSGDTTGPKLLELTDKQNQI